MKILAVQNRMGIGDTVIFLPYIEAISKKFNSPVSLLVKKSSKADQYLNQTNYLDKIIFLERDKKNKERHNGIMGSFRLAQDLKRYQFDKIFIFNSSLRFNLISRLANIKEIYQYSLFKKTDQHIIQPAKDLIKKNLLFLKLYIFSITDKKVLEGTLFVGPEPPIPKRTFCSLVSILKFKIAFLTRSSLI